MDFGYEEVDKVSREHIHSIFKTLFTVLTANHSFLSLKFGSIRLFFILIFFSVFIWVLNLWSVDCPSLNNYIFIYSIAFDNFILFLFFLLLLFIFYIFFRFLIIFPRNLVLNILKRIIKTHIYVDLLSNFTLLLWTHSLVHFGQSDKQYSLDNVDDFSEHDGFVFYELLGFYDLKFVFLQLVESKTLDIYFHIYNALIYQKWNTSDKPLNIDIDSLVNLFNSVNS